MNHYEFKDTKINDVYSNSFKNNVLDNVREKMAGSTIHRISNRTVDRDMRQNYFNEDVFANKENKPIN